MVNYRLISLALTPYIHMHNFSDITTNRCRVSGMEGGTQLLHMIPE